MPVEQDIVRKVWLKGSDPPLGAFDIAAAAGLCYISALSDHAPLLTADPGELLEPAPSATSTETTRFTRYVVLGYASSQRTVLACVVIRGTGHIYVDTTSYPVYNYRYYAKLVKTSDFATFTDASSEATIMSYSRAAATTAGWYDDGPVSGTLCAKVTLSAGEALLLQVRGTSWSSTDSRSSIGIKTANFRVSAALLV